MPKILVLGTKGMLGSQVYKELSRHDKSVYGYSRTGFTLGLRKLSQGSIDIFSRQFASVIRQIGPGWIINCIGLIKQRHELMNPESCIRVNALFPRITSSLCEEIGANLIHFSTDCVFSGKKGGYTENDTPDARDIYGRSKLLGEVTTESSLTIRTSIIGHELTCKRSLLEWAISQRGHRVNGFRNAIFSGLPTVELARVLREYILPNPGSAIGLLHVSSDPISKHDLLHLISNAYDLKLTIEPEEKTRIDRSLDSSLFRRITGYRPKPWDELVSDMRIDSLMDTTTHN